MIYNYEAKVLEHINKAIPEIKLATYAEEIAMFQSMSKVVKYPSLLYYRQTTDWTFPAFYTVTGDSKGVFSSFEQVYVGRIYFANQGDALQSAHILRYYLLHNPYINVPYNIENDNVDSVEVGLRLLYIKVGSDRPGNDKVGPQRYVELSWRSNLFFLETDPDYKNSLVEEVHIYLDTDGAHIMSKNNLIAIIK